MTLTSCGQTFLFRDVLNRHPQRLCCVLLQALRAGVTWGQDQFQLLLQESHDRTAGSGPAEDVGLEELRYRWMLYKSKLRDVGDIRARLSSKVGGQSVTVLPPFKSQHSHVFSFKYQHIGVKTNQ